MAGDSVAMSAAVRAMVEPCGDETVAGLARAVRAMRGARAAELAAALDAEVADRALRDQVLVAVAPLFRPRADEVEAPHYPAVVLRRLWKGITAIEPGLAERWDPDEEGPADRLVVRCCALAAARLREDPASVWPSATAGEADDLAVTFDLAPLVRRALPGLQTWVGRPDADQTVELRLLVKDAAGLAPDGAQRVMEMLFAQMADASLILRILVLSTGLAAKEEFLQGSELAGLVERLIEAVTRRAERLEAFSESMGAGAAQTAAADVAWCADMLEELAITLALSPGSPWGKQVNWLRGRVSKRVTAWLGLVDKRVSLALPTARSLIVGRMSRAAPDLTAPAEGDAIETARALLTLVGGMRQTAGQFGHEGQRRQVVEDLTLRLTTYADEVLEAIAAGEADLDHGLALIETAAAFLALIDERGPARTVRRRAAALRGERDAALALAREDAIG